MAAEASRGTAMKDQRRQCVLEGDNEIRAQALWPALLDGDDCEALFRSRDGLLLVEADDWDENRRLRARQMDVATIRAYIGERVGCLVNKKVGDDWEQVVASPPKDLVEYMMCNPPSRIRPLRRLMRCPAWLGRKPRLVKRGYDRGSGTLIDPASCPEFDVSMAPSESDAAGAVAMLREPFCDFPFETDADFANAVAVALTVVVRPLFDGPSPLLLCSAPSIGSGKTMLLLSLLYLALGEVLPLTAEGHSEEEWRKRSMSALSRRPAAIVIDNVRRPIDSATLAAVLTSTVFADRRLGKNDEGSWMELPNDALWCATGNNPRLSDEIARRTVQIRLVPNCERPWDRSEFRYSMPRHLMQHHDRYLPALHTLVARWVHLGCPRSSKTFASYEDWAAVVGGILEAVGLDAFLDNRDAVWSSALGDLAHWDAFVEAWCREFGDNSVRASELVPLAVGMGVMDALSGEGPHGTVTRLGKLLRRVRGMVFGAQRVVGDWDAHSKSHRWRLSRVDEA